MTAYKVGMLPSPSQLPAFVYPGLLLEDYTVLVQNYFKKPKKTKKSKKKKKSKSKAGDAKPVEIPPYVMPPIPPPLPSQTKLSHLPDYVGTNPTYYIPAAERLYGPSCAAPVADDTNEASAVMDLDTFHHDYHDYISYERLEPILITLLLYRELKYFYITMPVQSVEEGGTGSSGSTSSSSGGS